MLELVTSLLAGFLVPLIKDLVADWRRDQDLKRLGAAEAEAKGDQHAAESERKAGAVLGERRSVGDAAGRLSRGDF